jgi:hypothetical protein
MDTLQALLASTGFSTLLITIFGAWQNRKINRIKTEAEANTAEADYSERIIKQANERVDQAIDDRNRAIADRDRIRNERDAAYGEIKVQRKAKQEWREKFYAEQESKHALHLKLKDTELKMSEERSFRCEVEDCPNRKPPRKRVELNKKETK